MVLNGTIRLKCLEGNANRIPGVLNDLKGGIKGFKMRDWETEILRLRDWDLETERLRLRDWDWDWETETERLRLRDWD